MRGTVARHLRREAYGPDDSPRWRKYEWTSRGHSGVTMKDGKRYANIFARGEFIIAGAQRRFYQQLKKAHTKGESK